jgi:HEAT repeat protein
MNPSKSYPIEQSYINLAIIPAKEQYEKEKQLGNTQHVSDITSTFEKIYGTKTPIDMKNIFETCKNQEKQVLVFGRAGIGKSTFCRYIAYQWAISAYWPQYELLALIPLRRLTANRYPSDKNYSLLDIVKKEVFQNDLTDKEEQLLKNQFDARKTLWILDGYDEIAQNVPPHLECLFEQLLQTPHHIITSRPYMNTLSYDVQMEVTGFTDENIVKYVEQFFDQMKNELDDATIKSQRLLHFLRINSSIWGVAHIPVNLELICSIWSNEDWPEIEQLTMTTLYTMMTEWLCRRYLTPPNKPIVQLSKDEIDERCQKELTFLENLAFSAIDSNTIIIPPSLLTQALKEAKVSLQDHPNILNIGILKSFNKKGTGTQIEVDKDHYFVHLSFQEYFAARYLINTIKQSPTPKVIEFIKHQKYNQRYALVFTFAAGILNENDPKICFDIFWDNILGEPLDLVGIRHMQLVITCIEETLGKSTLPQRVQLLEWIGNCIKYCFSKEHQILREYFLQLLPRAQSVVCDQIIMNVFVDLLQDNSTDMHATVLKFLSKLWILNPSIALITSVATKTEDKNELVRKHACLALGLMSGKKATSEVISKLVNALSDESKDVRSCACQAFSIMDKKAVTDEVISELATALSDKDSYVRWSAGCALNCIGEKAATDEVISKLAIALVDQALHVRKMAYDALRNMSGVAAAQSQVISTLMIAFEDGNKNVRVNACQALREIGEKVVTKEIIIKLINALDDENEDVKCCAYETLKWMGKKVTTNEVIIKLINALRDESLIVRLYAWAALVGMDENAAMNEIIIKLTDELEDDNVSVRLLACQTLKYIGKKAATDDMINKLTTSLEHDNVNIRIAACQTLANMGEKAATDEVINKLTTALGHDNVNVRVTACQTLANMGEKAATDEVINKLTTALGHDNVNVRVTACQTLANMGEKAMTNEVINKVMTVLGHDNVNVRVNAWWIIANMGEKATTDEVISKIVTVLEDDSKDVRCIVWDILCRMGERAATDAVISKIVTVIESDKEDVRSSACAALLNMGEKAAKDEVISKLLNALRDENGDVRVWACRALGNIGKKEATDEIISGLVSALGDENRNVRWCACQVLGDIDKKAATNKIINGLLNVLGDKDMFIRQCACKILGKMNEKVATNEVISRIADIVNSSNDWLNDSYSATWAVSKILSSPDAIKQLKPEIISNLPLSKDMPDWLENLSSDQLIDIFFTTRERRWLSPIFRFMLLRGIAVTATENKVVVYDRKEPLELSAPNMEVCQQLIINFTEQRKELRLDFGMHEKFETILRSIFSFCDMLWLY